MLKFRENVTKQKKHDLIEQLDATNQSNLERLLEHTNKMQQRHA